MEFIVVILYENGQQIEVLIPAEEAHKPLWVLAEEGKIKVKEKE